MKTRCSLVTNMWVKASAHLLELNVLQLTFLPSIQICMCQTHHVDFYNTRHNTFKSYFLMDDFDIAIRWGWRWSEARCLVRSCWKIWRSAWDNHLPCFLYEDSGYLQLCLCRQKRVLFTQPQDVSCRVCVDQNTHCKAQMFVFSNPNQAVLVAKLNEAVSTAVPPQHKNRNWNPKKHKVATKTWFAGTYVA